jgi:hypothetical protein
MLFTDIIQIYDSLTDIKQEFFKYSLRILDYQINRKKYINHKYNFILTNDKKKIPTLYFLISEIQNRNVSIEDYESFFNRLSESDKIMIQNNT